MKPGKHQRSKQRCQDLCWKVRDPAQSFVLRSYTMHELSYFHNHSPLLTMTPHRNGVAVHFNVPRDWFGKETRRIKNVTLKAAKKKKQKKKPWMLRSTRKSTNQVQKCYIHRRARWINLHIKDLFNQSLLWLLFAQLWIVVIPDNKEIKYKYKLICIAGGQNKQTTTTIKWSRWHVLPVPLVWS